MVNSSHSYIMPTVSVVHTWKFLRTGGLDQVALATGADLLALDQLDQKLWVALSCPVKGLERDEKTLALIDTDGDGRIRAPELLAALKWAAARLTDPGVLLTGADALPLAAIDTSTPDGKILFASANQILANLGRKDAAAITVAAGDAEASGKLATVAEKTSHADKAKPEPKKLDLALITGIGVAIGSIGTFIATLFAKFVDVPGWQLPLILVGLLLVISLPSMFIAALKLRQRTLGPILEGNGWAVNGRVKINIPLGTALTEIATLPAGSKRSLDDPYEDKEAARQKRRVTVLVVFAVLAAAAVCIRW